MDFFEHDTTQPKLYDREVTVFLLRYVLRYTRYLYTGIILVALITGVSLVAPLCSKIIIDRYVIKSGYIVYPDKYIRSPEDSDSTRSGFIAKKLRLVKTIGNGCRFILRADLRYFSEKEVAGFKKKAVFSEAQYILIESFSKKDSPLYKKIEILAGNNEAIQYPDNVVLIRQDVYDALSLTEVLSLRSHDLHIISGIVLFLVLLFFLQFIASYYQNMTLMKLSQYAMRDLRVDLFKRILSYEVNYFDHNPLGRLVNRVTNDIEVLNEMFSSVLVNLFQDIILLTSITVIMFHENVYLAMVVAVTFPLLVIVTWFFRIQSTNKYRAIREVTARMNGFLSESISGIRIIQIFVAEAKNLKKFHAVNMELYRQYIGQMYVYAVFRPFIDFIKWFCVASVLYFGAQGIAGHAISFGVLVLFMQYISNFFDPISDLSEKFDTMISATAAGEKIVSVMKSGARIENTPISGHDAKRLTSDYISEPATTGAEKCKGFVEFKNVWFRYTSNDWVLKDLSLTIQPKQTIAIVGESGAGKSTIISLLSRLYDIQKGSILVDGKSIQDIPYEILRKNIAIVMQDVFLFSKTVRENITLNAPYNEERFRFVCEITHVDRFIKKLSKGDREPVMERGVTFSAGERQLISFARALYFDPSILVLDEATSNIDSETEKLIQDAIGHLIQNRTSILIAHRLSTICHADLIVVMEKGRIVETGKHNDLIKSKGMYYTLYRLQFQDV